MAILHKVILPFLSLTLLIQAAEPPADVDTALRSRIQTFYQLQVDKKFRQAEQLVAEDTKDLYYAMQKPDLKAFAIKKIDFDPDFRSAKVALTLRRTINFMGAGPQMMDMPATTTWKIDNGQWCWYVDQSKPRYSPLGTLTNRPNPKPTDDQQGPPDIAARLSGLDPSAGVQADRTSIQIDLQHPAPQIVTLKNKMPGPVTIQSLSNSPALKVEIANAQPGANESTRVTVTPVAGSADRPAELILKIGPLGQIIRIALNYAPAK